MSSPWGSIWQRLVRGVRHAWQRGDWAGFAGADWANGIMQAQVTDRFHAKQGRSTGRWILASEGRTLGVYLKRHYRLPWLHGVGALVWPWARWSPGVQEFRNLTWAKQQGLPVPEPVAMAETIGPWGKLQSLLAVEELTGMLDLHVAIPMAAQMLPAKDFRVWKRGLARELARLSRMLHDARHYHQDWYLCHFFIAEEDLKRVPQWRDRVRVIDFHRLGHKPVTGAYYRIKDLAQLLYSTFIPGIDARDRMAFWKAYHAGGSHSLLARIVRYRCDRYRRHNDKRKQAGLHP